MEKFVTFVNKYLIINMQKMKNIVKLEIVLIIQGNIEVLCKITKCAVIKNSYSFYGYNYGYNYDYNFIIKHSAEEFKTKFSCLGENTEKYITFRVPIEKQATRIDKNVEEIKRNISFILQFIDSTRLMASSLSNIANNLSVGIHKIKCKYGHDDKKCEMCGIT